MASFSNTVTIDRPIADVYSYLADFENVPTWNHAIVETRKSSPGPLTVGTSYVQRRQLPEPGEERFTVTEVAEERRLAIEGTIGPFPARLRYEFEPMGSSTVLTNSVELELTGRLRLLGGIGVARVRSAVAENLQVLKRQLESQAI